MNVLREGKQIFSRMSPEIFLGFYEFVITDCCFIRMNKSPISNANIVGYAVSLIQIKLWKADHGSTD